MVSTGRPSVTARVVHSPSSSTARMKSSVTRTEWLAFWKKSELVGAAGAVDVAGVAGLDEGPGLLLLDLLAADELLDVGVVDVEDHHLGGAPGLAAALDDAGEGVEALHEGHRPGGRAAAGERLLGGAEGRQVAAGPRAVLEQHALGACASSRIDGMVSSTELMKQAEHWGSGSMPTLNHTGELKQAIWWSRMCWSSRVEGRRASSGPAK